MLRAELWRPVEGYESYKVSTLGRVRGLRGTILRPAPTHNGYLAVSLLSEGVRLSARVHRLVATAFLPNPEGKPQVNHLDSDRTNNVVDNLEWATAQENVAHAAAKGRMSRTDLSGHGYWYGRRRPTALLTEDQVRTIRARRASGARECELAREFSVSRYCVRALLSGETYRYVEG